MWKAEADDVSGHHGLTRLVAVKTVKEGASVREREDLLRELGIMQQLGAHPNVVTLLGCCTEKGKCKVHLRKREIKKGVIACSSYTVSGVYQNCIAATLYFSHSRVSLGSKFK